MFLVPKNKNWVKCQSLHLSFRVSQLYKSQKKWAGSCIFSLNPTLSIHRPCDNHPHHQLEERVYLGVIIIIITTRGGCRPLSWHLNESRHTLSGQGRPDLQVDWSGGCNHSREDDDEEDDGGGVDNDDGVDIYIMMKCLSVCHEKWALPPGSLL